MTRFNSPLFLLPLALVAGACSSSFDERYAASRPIDERLPIEVSTSVALQDVQTDSNGRLTPEGRRQASAFLAAYKRDGSGPLEIQVGRGGKLGAAAEGEIRDIASIYGIPRNAIRLANYVPDPGSAATTRLAFARYVASVPACDNVDWSQNLAMTWDNTVYPSFGCARQQNLAAMASDPRDLVRMQAPDPRSADRRGVMNEKYEKGESPSSARTEGDSGKLAPVQSGTERK